MIDTRGRAVCPEMWDRVEACLALRQSTITGLEECAATMRLAGDHDGATKAEIQTRKLRVDLIKYRTTMGAYGLCD